MSVPERPRIPTFDELALNGAGIPTAQGVFGETDDVGTINHQTPPRVAAAAREVIDGKIFSLNAEISAFHDGRAERPVARRTVVHHPGYFDDYLDSFALQGSSQWDSLGHVGFGPDEFYNGTTEEQVASGARNGIDHWARRGIAGRGVVLDMVRLTQQRGDAYAPGTSRSFSVADLEAAFDLADVTPAPGDILMIHTGFAAWYAALGVEERSAVELAVPGLEHSRDMCAWLWDRNVSAVVADNYSVEVWPPDWSQAAFPWGQLHAVLIGTLGLALGEMWWLSDLAADCARDGRSTCLVTSAPFNVRGGHGSPANALALK